MQFHLDGDTEEYISNQKYKAKFSKLVPSNDLKPSNRIDAGYAFDSESEIVYMFGGHSDETNMDLNDFWQYNLKSNCWSLIQEDTSISPRCGQKMVFDPFSKQIFMLGHRSREYDNFKVRDEISNENLISKPFHHTWQNDFYLYDVQRKSWLLIFEDVSLMNGPSLLYDHQMCLNPRDRTIYVFGGKVVSK